MTKRHCRGRWQASRAAACPLAVVAFLLTVLGTSSDLAFAQSTAFSTASDDWQGLSGFVRAAQRKWGAGAVQVTSELDYGKINSGDSLVIFSPEVRLNGESLTSLLAAGGRVAVLDDFGKSPDFLQRFGIRRYSVDRRPEHSLRSDPDLPIALPSVESLGGSREGRHPMTLGVDRVVANHPMYLEHPNLTSVLEVPFADGTSAALAVTGIISGKGRLLALGDPSVFINLMMRYPGNRALAEGLLDYLMERDPGETGPRKLWIVSGNFSQVGSFGDEDGLARHIRETIEELGSAVERLREQGMPSSLALALAALLAVVVLSREVKRNFSPRLQLSPAFARPRLLAAQTGPASRAEVLGARSASPLLPVIEMDVALREALEIRLQVRSGLPSGEMQAALLGKGLSATDAKEVVVLLSETRKLAGSLASRRASRPSRPELKRLHQRAMHLLSAIKQAERQS